MANEGSNYDITSNSVILENFQSNSNICTCYKNDSDIYKRWFSDIVPEKDATKQQGYPPWNASSMVWLIPVLCIVKLKQYRRSLLVHYILVKSVLMMEECFRNVAFWSHQMSFSLGYFWDILQPNHPKLCLQHKSETPFNFHLTQILQRLTFRFLKPGDFLK